jgi:RNA-binding protein 39
MILIFFSSGANFFLYFLLDPETGRSKGFGFIQYKNSEDAKQALEKMNGFELAGRNVSWYY